MSPIRVKNLLIFGFLNSVQNVFNETSLIVCLNPLVIAKIAAILGLAFTFEKLSICNFKFFQ